MRLNTRLLRIKAAIEGAAIVELAVLLPLFIFILIFATDVTLAILARTQVDNAARAGAEYATTQGASINGIRNAALGAATQRAIRIQALNVRVSSPLNDAVAAPVCGCVETGTLYATGDTTPACTNLNLVCTGVAGNLFSNNYLKVTVEAEYSPLFIGYWSRLIFGNKFKSSVVTRTY